MVHLTHGDLDGAACGVISGLIYPDRELYAGPFEAVEPFIKKQINIFEEEPKDTVLFVSDMTMKKETYEKCLEVFGTRNVYLFDHHPESDELKGLPGVYVNRAVCGARVMIDALATDSLFYDSHHFIADPEKEFFFDILDNVDMDLIELVNVWDMWLVEDPLRPTSEALNNLFSFLEFDLFVKKLVEHYSSLSNGYIKDINFSAEELWENIGQEENEYLDAAIDRVNTYEIAVLQAKVAWCVASRHISKLCERMLLRFGSDIAVIYNIENNAMHIRTSPSGKFNAGEIAKAIISGGGHMNAAGGKINYMAPSNQHAGGKPIVPLPVVDAVSPEQMKEIIEMSMKEKGLSTSGIPKGAPSSDGIPKGFPKIKGGGFRN